MNHVTACLLRQHGRQKPNAIQKLIISQNIVPVDAPLLLIVVKAVPALVTTGLRSTKQVERDLCWTRVFAHETRGTWNDAGIASLKDDLVSRFIYMIFHSFCRSLHQITTKHI